ncbi:MAG: cadherin-like beta sandwich domain-containing protein, partial [Acidobacteriota bacterium]
MKYNRTTINRGTQITLLILAAVIMTVICMGILTSTAHAVAVAPDVYWDATYGGAKDEVAYAVYADVYGYTFTGSARADSGFAKQIWVVHTDVYGNKQWEQKYLPDWLAKADGRSISKTSDGGYIIGGTRRINNDSLDKVDLIKTDATGGVQWERTFGIANCDTSCFGVVEASDGGFVITGTVMFGGRINGQTDVYAAKVDAAGNVLWERNFGSTGWDWGYSIAATGDGGYIIAGQKEVPGANRPYVSNVYVIKLDGAGNEQWERNYGTNMIGSQAKSIAPTADNGYILTGFSGYTVMMMKLDTNGVKKWETTFANGIGYSVQQTASGSFIATGRSEGLGIYLVMADSRGNRLWEKFIGSGADEGHSIRQMEEGGYLIAGSKSTNGGDGYLAYIKPDVTATLGTSSSNVLNKGSVLVYGTLYNDDGTLNKGGAGDVKVKITDVVDEIELKDDGSQGDMSANDGVYSGWVQIDNNKPAVTIELMVNGIRQDIKSINIITTPTLVVLTNLEELHSQFTEKGMTKDDDVNANSMPDYYDVVKRISQYANDHNGIVFDLKHEITAANGYSNDYSSLSYTNDTALMGTLIDKLIKNISDVNHFQYVAIVGDDRAVPAFRRWDPTRYEYTYPVWMANFNQGMKDIGNGKILTDIPYGSYDDANPDGINKPKLDAGIGRIYANNPDDLRKMIIAYESRINLIPGSSGAIYSMQNDNTGNPDHDVAFDVPVKKGPLKVMKRSMARDGYEWFDGNFTKWKATDITTSIPNNEVTVIWTHANHMAQQTPKADPDIGVAQYNAMADGTGHLYLGLGCHGALSASYQSPHTAQSNQIYNTALVKGLLLKHVTYAGPTSYGYTGSDDVLAYHGFFLTQYLSSLLDNTSGTVGSAQLKAYNDFWARTPADLADDVYSVTTAYGMGFYGLPTQVIERASFSPPIVSSPRLLAEANSPELLVKAVVDGLVKTSTSDNISFSVDVPHFDESTDSEGKKIFSIPNNDNFVQYEFAPYLPLVVKSYLLPKGSLVNGVNLVNQTRSLYPEPVDMQIFQPVSLTSGLVEGTANYPNPYPQQLFWWSTAEESGGVRLIISVVPLQYNKDTKIVTLYNHMEFSVSYDKAGAGASIESVAVNSGASLTTGMPSVPITVEMDSDGGRAVKLMWTIKDRSGSTVDSGVQDLTLSNGSRSISINTATVGWNPGSYDATIALSENDTILDTMTSAINVAGIGLTANMSKNSYLPQDGEAVLKLQVRNEQGVPVAGLNEASISVRIDGNSVTSTVYEDSSSGNYEIRIPLAELTESLHQLEVACRDARGLSQSTALEFAYASDHNAPLVASIIPAVNAVGVSVDSTVAIKFNEDVVPSTSFDGIVLIDDDGAEVETTTSLSGPSLKIKPKVDLDINTLYTVMVPAGAVKDLAGNDLAEQYTSYFLTSQTVRPLQVVDTTPENGTANVLVGANVSLTYNRSIQEAVYFNSIEWKANDSTVGFVYAIQGNTVVLAPDHDLPYSASCTVTVPAGAVMDLNGSVMDSVYSFSFTTQPDPAVVLTAPVWLSAVPVSPTEIDLNWQSVSSAVYYNVFRSDSENGTYLKTGESSNATYHDWGLTPATAYWYKLTASNNNYESVMSSAYCVTTLDVPPVLDTTAPSWPGKSLQSQDVKVTELKLVWTPAVDNVGVLYYAVYQDGNLLTDSIAANVQEYLVLGLTPDTVYNFRVEARDAAGNWSADGPTLAVTTPKVLSSNAFLSALSTDRGPLVPDFVKDTINYSLDVDAAVENVTITAVVEDPTASIKINGADSISGTTYGPIALVTGANPITVKVTAQDGTEKTYTITVTRAAAVQGARLASLEVAGSTLDPVFDSETFNYNVLVPYLTESLVVSATANTVTAAVYIDGEETGTRNKVLNVGANSVEIVVHSIDGSSVNYAVNILRGTAPPSNNADLANISLSSGTLTPAFGSTITDYTAKVNNNISSVTVSAVAADAKAEVAVTQSNPVPLNVGDNEIKVQVTAEDGTTIKTYTITVTREEAPVLSNDANLCGLYLSKGELSPAFDGKITEYSATVSNDVYSVTVTPMAANVKKSIVISPVNPVALYVGPNVITVEVIAEDGTTKKTYTIHVTREPEVLSITTNSLVYGMVDSPYSVVMIANGGQAPYTWRLTGLSAGLSINSVSGEIYGKPTAVGTSVIAAWVYDSTGQSANKELSIEIRPAPLVINNDSLPTGEVGIGYNTMLSPGGGVAPYTWNIAGLPKGLDFDSVTGAVYGKPVQAGTVTVTAAVYDSSLPILMAQKELTLKVNTANTNNNSNNNPGSGNSSGGGGGSIVQPVTGVTLDKHRVVLTIGGARERLTATVHPDNAVEKKVIWSSNREKIVSVIDGVLIPLAPGEATITVTTSSGYKTDTCLVIVQEPLKVKPEPNVQAPAGAAFSDTKGHWASGTIQELTSKGYLGGYSNNTFKPNQGITRVEFAVLTAKILGLKPDASGLNKFKDASKIGSWARPYVGALLKAGMIKGYEDSTFKPARIISRAEMATLIIQALKITPSSKPKFKFADTNNIPG